MRAWTRLISGIRKTNFHSFNYIQILLRACLYTQTASSAFEKAVMMLVVVVAMAQYVRRLNICILAILDDTCSHHPPGYEPQSA